VTRKISSHPESIPSGEARRGGGKPQRRREKKFQFLKRNQLYGSQTWLLRTGLGSEERRKSTDAPRKKSAGIRQGRRKVKRNKHRVRSFSVLSEIAPPKQNGITEGEPFRSELGLYRQYQKEVTRQRSSGGPSRNKWRVRRGERPCTKGGT